MNKDKKNKNENWLLKKYAKYTSIAFQMGVIVALGTWGGTELDEKYKCEQPYFTITLSLISVAVAIYIAIRDFINFEK